MHSLFFARLSLLWCSLSTAYLCLLHLNWIVTSFPHQIRSILTLGLPPCTRTLPQVHCVTPHMHCSQDAHTLASYTGLFPHTPFHPDDFTCYCSIAAALSSPVHHYNCHCTLLAAHLHCRSPGQPPHSGCTLHISLVPKKGVGGDGLGHHWYASAIVGAPLSLLHA